MTSKLQQLSDQTKQRKAAILRPELRPYGPEFPPVYDQTVLDALRHTCFDEGVLNAKMVAREIGKAESTAYDKLRGDVEITLAEFCRIVRLSVAHGSQDLIDMMLPENFVVYQVSEITDGETLADEMEELVREEGEASAACQCGQLRKAERAATNGVTTAAKIARTVKGAKR